MKKNIAVSINNVSKSFHLPQDNYDSVKLKLQNIFGKKKMTTYQALKDVNLEVKKGEFIGILGRNGAGKSTLLKIIAEIYRPTGGSVEVNGRMAPFIELGVGFNKHLSGRDNVYLNGAMLGFTRPEIDEMYDSIVDFAELHKFMNQKLRNYSSGMKVRLAFSIAIKANADILLLDEVLAVGDAAFRRKCYDYFSSLQRSDKTIILVTHNMSAVRNHCDRAVLLEGGSIVFDGGPEEAVEEYYKVFDPKSQDEGPREKELTLEDIHIEQLDDSLAFKLDMKNHTNKMFADVLVRLAVKKQNGRVVAGFDNKNIDKPFAIDFNPHENKTLVYEVPNIFGSGNYSINAAIRQMAGKGDDVGTNIDDAPAYDSRQNFAIFSVEKPGTATPVILPVNIKDTNKSKSKASK